jgi:hypothetical protein
MVSSSLLLSALEMADVIKPSSATKASASSMISRQNSIITTFWMYRDYPSIFGILSQVVLGSHIPEEQ